MEKEYIPFGPEWKAEVRKGNKDDIIDLLRRELIHVQELEYEIQQLKAERTTIIKEIQKYQA